MLYGCLIIGKVHYMSLSLQIFYQNYKAGIVETRIIIANTQTQIGEFMESLVRL